MGETTEASSSPARAEILAAMLEESSNTDRWTEICSAH
jgi:hypothetical protein